MNMQQMLMQAQKMQRELQKAQDELKKKEFTIFYAICEVSGGVVVQILKHHYLQ